MKAASNAGGSAAQTPVAKFSIRPQVLAGILVLVGLFGGLVGWAGAAKLSGAIIAPGTIVVERHVKKIQHRDGGIVAVIHVQDGNLVKPGQILVKLDDTQLKAELAIVDAQMTELTVRKQRLAAERDGLDSIKFSDEIRNGDQNARSIMSGEERLFNESRKSRDSQKQQLTLRITQLEDEITGLTAQKEAKKNELALIDKELVQVRSLNERKLAPISRVLAMEREANRLEGERGNLVAQIARAKGQISEIQVQLINVDQTVRTESQRELRQIEARLSEIAERRIAAQDKLDRVEIRAPIAGIVHELSVHTVGGVITPAEPVLLIVPASDKLIVEAKFLPSDIDQLLAGSDAVVRLSAFNKQKTPEVRGKVLHVSADVTRSPHSNIEHYVGKIQIDPAELQKLTQDVKLIPGMPVEVFVATDDRTALSYLMKPFTDQMRRAFRE